MDTDEEHLRLLSIFHYVVAGILALFACFPMLWLVAGVLMLVIDAGSDDPDQPPVLVGVLFIGIAIGLMVIGWAVAVCVLLAGRYLAQHRHYVYCMVIAGLLCMFGVFGIVLGVFTIVVLCKPSVKALFAGAAPPLGEGAGRSC